jgi:hypothetical protein
MDIQKTMRARDNFVWAVLETPTESTEDRKEAMSKVAQAWLFELHHQGQKGDINPDSALLTVKLAADVLETLKPLLEVLHDTVGTHFNAKQAEALSGIWKRNS